jgi:alpha-L-glutamate ligase-like protein
MIGLARRLREAGVLGVNGRNAEFILIHNMRRFYPLADDKLRTKRVAEAAGIAVPTLYAVIEAPHETLGLSDRLGAYTDFVVKPAGGSGGDGIMVIAGRIKDMYRTAGGNIVTDGELRHHVNGIISGIYSLGGQPDKCLIEYRVQFDPVFEAVSFEGVPDIRIVVFLGVPVMAMVRLPTRMSKGRANLHQGAIGAGIDIATGRTLTAVWRNAVVEEHPDTATPVSGITVPHWHDLLVLAARSFELSRLGYQGIDIVLDKDRGPMVLELNARPGLNIQIANRAGLRPRLERVRAKVANLRTVLDRVAFAKANFGATG